MEVKSPFVSRSQPLIDALPSPGYAGSYPIQARSFIKTTRGITPHLFTVGRILIIPAYLTTAQIWAI